MSFCFKFRSDYLQITPRLIANDNHLHSFCRKGNYKKVKEFIRTYKSDLPLVLAHRQGLYGYTPVHEAVSHGHSKVLKVLLLHDEQLIYYDHTLNNKSLLSLFCKNILK